MGMEKRDAETMRKIAELLHTCANNTYYSAQEYDFILRISEATRAKMHEVHCEPADLFRAAANYLNLMAENYEKEDYIDPSIAAIKQLGKECPALYSRIASVTPNSNGLKFTFYNKNEQEDPDMCLNTYKEENENE